jgi:outer membrane lipoprotein SlyB
MTSSTTPTSATSPDLASPGAVAPAAAKPIAWWIAGGLGLLGAGALAATLVAGPKNPAPASPETKPSLVAAKASKLAAAPVCTSCGTVESVKSEKHKGEGTGLGAVGGAVVGGVVGHQMGGGDGKKALTVLGAVGGGFAGHEVEKQVRSTTVYQVQMRMDDGSSRTLTHSTAPAVGTRFEIRGTQLKPLAAKG